MKMANALLSAPASIAGDDSFEDGCSICLEPFNSINPPTVTKCKHEYHFQCILEWSQRSDECPICSQHLVLKDPASQELLAGLQSDRTLKLRHSFHSVNQDIDVNNDAHEEDDPDFEQRIMRHFTTVANRARDISGRRRLVTPADGNLQVLPSVPATTTNINISNATDVNSFSEVHQNLASCFSYIDSANSVGASTFTQQSSSSVFPSFGNTPACTSENTHYSVKSSQLPLDNPGRSSSSEFVAFSESLKSKISKASTRYKESISKSTRGLKEKLIARNDSVMEISREVQREMSAGIARMIERLDLTQKRAGVSATLSNYTTGTSKPPHLAKREDTNIQSLDQNTEGTAYDKSLGPTPFSTNGISGGVEVSLEKDKD